MASFKIVSVYVLRYAAPRFADVCILGEVGFIILEGTEPTLDHDIVCPAAFAIHTLPDLISLQKIDVYLAGELASLIGVNNFWFGNPEGLLKSFYGHAGAEGVIQLPADNASAVPVDHRRKIEEAVLNRNIRNVNRPCLVWAGDLGITQQVWADLRLFHALGEVHFGINRCYIHLRHIPAHPLTADAESAHLQLIRHQTRAPGWIVCMKTVYGSFAFQFLIRDRGDTVIDACTVHVKQLCSD